MKRLIISTLSVVVFLLHAAGPARSATVVWDGSTDTTWSAGSDATSWSGAATYNVGDDAQFLGSGLGTVTLSGVINPGNVVVNSSGNYTFAGTADQLNKITGSSLTKSGTGTLHLEGRTHTFTGGITVNDGILSFDSSPRSNIGSSPLAVNGGKVSVSLENVSVTELSGSGGLIEVYRRRLTVDQATDTTYAGIIRDLNGVVSDGNGTAFTKTGSGTLTLTGDNTYSKNTTVSAGTLEVSGALYSGGTHSGSSITVGGTLDVTGAGFLGSGAVFGANIANSGTFDYNSTAAQTLSGVISGAGSLVKDNSSTLTLSGANSYSGGTIISGGTLKLGAAGVIPDGAGNTDVTVNGTLDLNGYSETINGLSGAGTVDNTSATAATLTVGNDNDTSTFSGTITNTAGALALTKTGSGSQTLSGANTYSGGTIISGGTLDFQNNDALGTGRIDVYGGGLLEFGVDALNLSEPVRASNNGGNRTIRLDLSGANTGTLSGQLDIRRTAAGEFDIDVGTDDTLTVSSAIVSAGGGAGLTKEGAGTLQIHVQSSYAGLTTVNGGILVIDNPTGTHRNFGAGNIEINNGATLQTTITGGGQARLENKTITFDSSGGGTINIVGSTRAGGTTVVTTGGPANYITGSLLDSGTITYNVADGQDAVDLQIGNSINRSGIIKNGAGTLRLISTANNLQSNPIDINAGVLELGDAGRLINGSYAGNIFNDGIFRHNSSNNQTLSGVISGSGSLEKDNTSTLTLSGACTYSGDTKITGGTLTLASGGSINTDSTVRISTSGKMDLDAGIDQTVYKLYLDGELQTAGTWGSSTSGANYQDDTYFSGDGILSVTTGSGVSLYRFR